MFLCKLDDICKDIPNVTIISDDIFIICSTEQDHDEMFINMFEGTHKKM